MHIFFSSKKVRLVVGIIGAFVLAILIFHAGVAAGTRRGEFGRRGMENGFRHSFLPGGFELPHGFISNAHGAVGTISAVTFPTLLMETREGTTQTIVVGTSTIIRGKNGANIKTFSKGNQIIVLGEPSGENRIDAKFIRVLSVATSTP